MYVTEERYVHDASQRGGSEPPARRRPRRGSIVTVWRNLKAGHLRYMRWRRDNWLEDQW